MSISTAVGLARQSRISGYKIKKGFFSKKTRNLPQVVAILGQANVSNQSISTQRREVISSEEVGRIYGYGSPLHMAARILLPSTGGGLDGVPLLILPQLDGNGFTRKELTLTILGPATKNTTHSLIVCGRKNLDFKSYEYQVNENDSPSEVVQKISDIIRNNLSCPFEVKTTTVNTITFRTKFAGKVSNDAEITVDIQDESAGLAYSIGSIVSGTGTPDISSALISIENEWVTTVLNTYNEDVFDVLEQFNGVPYLENPTGRYNPLVFKPFMSFSGSTESNISNLVALTNDNSRINQVTNVLCVAPNSGALSLEVAANIIRLFVNTMQNSPEIDINGQLYPDLPVPADRNIGEMSNYNSRDFLVKNGCSTVTLEKGSYMVQDLVTTYHPEGETPIQFNYCRNLNLDWNVFDSYKIIESQKLRDRVLIGDNQITDSRNAIKPKEWKSIVFDLFDDLAKKALINDVEFSKNSLQVQINETNPNRFETFFRYKRTGISRIQSTTVEAGF